MAISTNRELPLHDEASGMDNLSRRQQRDLRVIDSAVSLAIGMVLGALIVFAVLLSFGVKPN